MQIELESSLDRWTQAALLNAEQAARIREFETARRPRRGARFPILIGLALGGIMLAAGVLLFVAAHWMDLSPTERMALVVFAVGAFHLAAAFCADRFSAMAVTLHAVGTAALGGAIFLAGQIFNMQEHWPTGILLWAIGALAGWWLLRQWPQLAFSALLVPVLADRRMAGYGIAAGASLSHRCGLRRLADDLLFERARSNVGRSNVRMDRRYWPAPSRSHAGRLELVGRHATLDARRVRRLRLDRGILLPLGFAFIYRKTQTWMNVVAAVWVGVLSALTSQPTRAWIFAWCAVGSAGMIAWGIHEFRAERVNLGMAGFALTVLFFYFSSVMDKLGRSASLIVLGVVFLAGAWYWEKLRRKLVARVSAGGVS